jgi:hypothetical protein
VVAAPGAVGQVYNCPAPAAGSTAVVTGATPTLGFFLSGRVTRNDLLTYNGRVELTNPAEPQPVPEVSSWMMAGAGLLVVAVRRAARRS